jgi:hypothetical protein
MSKITELLEGKEKPIDFALVKSQYPWILEREKNCILSPDSDGLLCGLFMSHYFGWKVVGFYDGKVLLLKKGISTRDDNCVFLDIEVSRPFAKSVGHHMLLWNNKQIPPNWMTNFSCCLQPNNLREYDGKNYFRLKYPLATIHLLMAIAGSYTNVEILRSAIAPLFFVDGTFNVLYSYPENVLNWLNFLRIHDTESPLRALFMHDHFSVYSQMIEMESFFQKRDKLSITGERGDKFVISDKDSSFKNIAADAQGTFRISDSAQTKVKGFLRLLAEGTEWTFQERSWNFEELQKFQFTKSSFEASGWKLNNKTFANFMNKNPLSWAMTSGTNIEFTLESPDSMP